MAPFGANTIELGVAGNVTAAAAVPLAPLMGSSEVPFRLAAYTVVLDVPGTPMENALL
jgi:hypothetical protein